MPWGEKALALAPLVAGIALGASAFAEQRPPGETPPAEKQPKAASGDIPEGAARLLGELLAQAGAWDAEPKKVDRTVERQTRVMYDLARADVEHAKEMYCDAGDAVIDRYDPKLGETQNLSRMKAELLVQLPLARELGCLNHIENDDVYSVDVAIESVPEAKRVRFVEAVKRALTNGKIERFLEPPRHPGAYHFEFRRE